MQRGCEDPTSPPVNGPAAAAMAQLFRTIMQGIPGTDMPGAQISDATPDQVWAVIAYLRTLERPGVG